MFGRKKEPYFIYSPMDGRVVGLPEVGDEIFAKGMMGTGAAIYPENEELYSPVDGTIIFVFPAKHAVGIEASDGTEMMIHIGIDTVQLSSEGFECHVEEGQEVKKGDKLLSFDKKLLESKGYQTVTLLLFPNREAENLQLIRSGEIRQGQEMIKVVR